MFRSRLLAQASLRYVARKRVMQLHTATTKPRRKLRKIAFVASCYTVAVVTFAVKDMLNINEHEPAAVVARLQEAVSDSSTLVSLHEVRRNGIMAICSTADI
jgi:hypothetical protein